MLKLWLRKSLRSASSGRSAQLLSLKMSPGPLAKGCLALGAAAERAHEPTGSPIGAGPALQLNGDGERNTVTYAAR